MSCLAGPSAAFDLPSGHPVTLQESFYEAQEDGALWARFRFVMPAMAEGLTYADVEQDFLTLCADYALPSMQGSDIPEQILISLADRETEFGVADADAIQFFEAFRIKDETCMWGDF